MAQRTDLVDLIIADHREVESAFSDYERGGLSDEQRRDLVDHLIAELTRHSVAEEQFLYPTVRERLDDGAEIADRETQEHNAAEQLMSELEGLQPDDREFDRKTRQLIQDIRQHVAEEENELLPRLREACSDQELGKLGEKMLKSKQKAPTVPHPTASERPPDRQLLEPGTGMIDRVRESMESR